MKKLICALLALAMVASLCACTTKPDTIVYAQDLPGTSAPAVDSNEDPTTTPETAPTEKEDSAETEQPTEAPIPKVTASDAFMDTLITDAYGDPATLCYHIPKFDMDTPAAVALNEKIYSKLYAVLEDEVYSREDQPFCFGMSYCLAQKEDIASLLVYMRMDWGLELFYAFHIYADGSAEVSKEELWSLYGYDESSFYALAEQKMEQKYIALYPDKNDPYYKEQLENTIAEENVKKVEPYIDANGDLCCIATIFSLAGAEAYDHLVNLTGSSDPVYPNCEINHG